MQAVLELAVDIHRIGRPGTPTTAMAQHFFAEPGADAHHVYVGACHDGCAAVFLLHLDATSGRLSAPQDDGEPLEPAAAVGERGAPWVTAHPSGSHAYTCVRDGEQNYIAGWTIDGVTGRLTPAQPHARADTELKSSPHCSVSPCGRLLVASAMSGGGAVAYALGPEGELPAAPTDVLKMHGGGSGVNPKRSTANLCHSAQMAMGGRHVLVPDLGADKVWSLALNADSSSNTKAGPSSPRHRCLAIASPPFEAAGGAGPRHLATHPNSK